MQWATCSRTLGQVQIQVNKLLNEFSARRITRMRGGTSHYQNDRFTTKVMNRLKCTSNVPFAHAFLEVAFSTPLTSSYLTDLIILKGTIERQRVKRQYNT